MTTTPAGLPAWARSNAHTTYGGDLEKTNYMGQDIVDAQTDVSAAQLCRMAADLEAVQRTAPFAVITYTCEDTAPAAPTVHSVYMMTGVSTVDYDAAAPPVGFPGAARNGDGDVTFTFAASYLDDYGVSSAFVPRSALATLHGATAGSVPCVIFGNDVTVRALDTTPAAIADAKVTLTVW